MRKTFRNEIRTVPCAVMGIPCFALTLVKQFCKIISLTMQYTAIFMAVLMYFHGSLDG